MNRKITTIVALLAVILIGSFLAYSAYKGNIHTGTILSDIISNSFTNNEASSTPSESITSISTTTSTSTQSEKLKTYTNTAYGISFKYPETYRDTTLERDSDTVLASFETAHTALSVKSIIPPSTQTYEQTLIKDVIYDGSGNHPKSFSEFKSRTINSKKYNWIVTGRFEGVITVNYYLKRDTDIVVFSSQSRDVADWSNSRFKVENDVGHQDLKDILSTALFSPLKIETQTIKLYYVNTKNPGFKTLCTSVMPVTRIIPKTEAIGQATLKSLFEGPTAAEKFLGIISPLESNDVSVASLGAYYIGLRISNGVATLYFSEGAHSYVDSSACAKASIKASIENTLQQFPSITSVEYIINNTPVTFF